MPQAAGGVTSLENLALACVSCSLRKGARTTAIDPGTGDAAQLFHPRIHAWNGHFIADVSGEILGLTAIGRAAITSLSMNRCSRSRFGTRNGPAIDGRDGLFAARGSELAVRRASTFHCARCRVAMVSEREDDWPSCERRDSNPHAVKHRNLNPVKSK
jgi:hypothetical protein